MFAVSLPRLEGKDANDVHLVMMLQTIEVPTNAAKCGQSTCNCGDKCVMMLQGYCGC